MSIRLIYHSGRFRCEKCGRAYRLDREPSLRCQEPFCRGILAPVGRDAVERIEFDPDEDEDDAEDEEEGDEDDLDDW